MTTSATHQGQYFSQQDADLSHQARHILRSERIDLDAFLALDREARARRWRGFDHAAKFQVCALMLTRKYGGWDDELVAAAIATYDARWDVSDRQLSDQTIPPAADILGKVAEEKKTAQQHGDFPGCRQLDRVRANIINGARLHWCVGDLLIQSVNNPGAVYSVNRRGCTCPNGAAGKATCWHVAIHDLLIEMQEDRAAAADIVADAASERAEQETDAAERADLGRRLATARARVAAY